MMVTQHVSSLRADYNSTESLVGTHQNAFDCTIEMEIFLWKNCFPLFSISSFCTDNSLRYSIDEVDKGMSSQDPNNWTCHTDYRIQGEIHDI